MGGEFGGEWMHVYEWLRPYPLHSALCQYRACQLAVVVKNPPARAGDLERWVWPLGREDPLEEGMATHSSLHAWSIPWTEEAGGATVQGVAESRTEWLNKGLPTLLWDSGRYYCHSFLRWADRHPERLVKLASLHTARAGGARLWSQALGLRPEINHDRLPVPPA